MTTRSHRTTAALGAVALAATCVAGIAFEDARRLPSVIARIPVAMGQELTDDCGFVLIGFRRHPHTSRLEDDRWCAGPGAFAASTRFGLGAIGHPTGLHERGVALDGH
ncbi:hypothetical protein [Embleya sp. MST-111070]|uniref:hypothetical protein n=1 Tax=Embleya sp. MST-111070 TaxID=3398231 RepID=UPI003F73B969